MEKYLETSTYRYKDELIPIFAQTAGIKKDDRRLIDCLLLGADPVKEQLKKWKINTDYTEDTDFNELRAQSSMERCLDLYRLKEKHGLKHLDLPIKIAGLHPVFIRFSSYFLQKITKNIRNGVDCELSMLPMEGQTKLNLMMRTKRREPRRKCLRLRFHQCSIHSCKKMKKLR